MRTGSKVVLAILTLACVATPALAGKKQERLIQQLERERAAILEQLAQANSQLRSNEKKIDELIRQLRDERERYENRLNAERQQSGRMAEQLEAETERGKECVGELTICQNTDAGVCRRQLQETSAKEARCESARAQDQASCKSSIREATTRVEGQSEKEAASLRREMKQGEQIFYLRGKQEVLDSIQVIGMPKVVEGIFLDDFYYQFQVKYKDRVVVLQEIKTERAESGFSRALGALGEIATAVLGRLR